MIGGGDWSKDRFIVDCIKSWIKNKSVKIRNPNATRPWQHVLEPLFGYLLLVEKAEKKKLRSSAYNFGPHKNQNLSVKKFLIKVKSQNPNINYRFEKVNYYESSFLSLDSSLIKKVINYKQTWDIDKSIRKTLNWYINFINKKKVLDLCTQDIVSFEKDFIK